MTVTDLPERVDLYPVSTTGGEERSNTVPTDTSETLTPDAVAAWSLRLKEASAARDLARDGFAATVRDAVAAGIPQGQIAKILDIKARSYIYQLADGGEGLDDDVPPVPLQPVIFMRGARVDNSVWTTLQKQLWTRRWPTTTKRTEACHLARGGTPVIFLDFSKRTADDLKVAGVRAVYRNDDLTLELINGGTVTMPRLPDGSLDTSAITRLVQEVIGDLPAINERRRLAARAETAAKH